MMTLHFLTLLHFLKVSNYLINFFFKLISQFFLAIVTADVDDVREVMVYYKQFSDPIEQFRENQRKLLEQMEEKQREEQLKAPSVAKKWTPSFLSHK